MKLFGRIIGILLFLVGLLALFVFIEVQLPSHESALGDVYAFFCGGILALIFVPSGIFIFWKLRDTRQRTARTPVSYVPWVAALIILSVITLIAYFRVF